MPLQLNDCCVLNGGTGGWAFAPLAVDLSRALGIDIVREPRRFNYVLNLEPIPDDGPLASFIPLPAIRLAADKRSLAAAFSAAEVPIPRTVLLPTFAEVTAFVGHADGIEWCLKFPTGCGGIGHRIVDANSTEPRNWPRPFVVQEFVRQERPEVYRTYAAGGELFGWVVRRFPSGEASSPWVAHSRGAVYEVLRDPPPAALAAAQSALVATGLWESFGCVDLIERPSGEWLVLEVGTDGLFNHVDRAIGCLAFEAELTRRICDAFWRRAVAGSG